MFNKIKNYFLTGVLVTAPVFLTFWVVITLVNFIDKLITPLIPYYLNPNFYLPRDVPGLGLIILSIFLIFIGFVTANFFGALIIKTTDKIIQNIPFIKTFYKTFKQIFETVFKTNSQAFRDVVMLEYPRKGIWVLGFTTGEVKGAAKKKIKKKLINVFVPTTPNPTSGFLLLVPQSDLKYLDVNVDDAVKSIVSAGIIPLNTKQT